MATEAREDLRGHARHVLGIPSTAPCCRCLALRRPRACAQKSSPVAEAGLTRLEPFAMATASSSGPPTGESSGFEPMVECRSLARATLGVSRKRHRALTAALAAPRAEQRVQLL